MIAWILEDILKITEGFHQTSTVDNLKDQSVTFANNIEWFQKLFNTDKEVFTLIPFDLKEFDLPEEVAKKIRPIATPKLTEIFVLFHNKVNESRLPKCNVWGENTKLHESMVVCDGMRYIKTDNGPVFMKHMGNVVIGNGVEIGPYSIIHRATIDSTTIEDNVKIGSLVNVGHNVVIGEGTFITPHVTIGGSTKIGRNCWVGMNSTIRDHISICEGVKIGMGSVVTKSIITRGVYLGCPAKRIGDWDGSI
jgi:acetyltransferase-like isoleucine patch superfamily enzyme